jgi:AhpD family alkylhydroperoxidase
MEERIKFEKLAHEPLHSLLAIEKYLDHSSIEPKLLHLVKMRASQINGCAYCLDMHSKDARSLGETEQRLYELNAWRETPFYSDRERAALEWTEALTLISQTHAPDESYEKLRAQFSEQEIVDLTYAIGAINFWNRLAISMRTVPGTYQPAQKSSAQAHA